MVRVWSYLLGYHPQWYPVAKGIKNNYTYRKRLSKPQVIKLQEERSETLL